MQAGYGLGLFFLVPLGDLADRRRLIPAQLLLLAVALTLVGTATTGAFLLVGMVAVGLLAVVTQTLVAFAASLAPAPPTRARRRGRDQRCGPGHPARPYRIRPARRSRRLAFRLPRLGGSHLRTGPGTAPALRPRNSSTTPAPTPPDSPPPTLRYGHLLRSTVTLFVRERLLRLRALFALLVFAAFSTLWSCVALPLSAPPHSLSDASIGAFGLAGAAGALAAATAGRLNDRGLSRRTTGIGLVLLTASWLPLAFTPHSLWALAVGVIILDFAVQAVHVTNQSLIYALAPDAGSRLIGGYMIFYSVGSASGAIASTSLYAAAGWGAVCALGAAISGLALLLWAGTRH